MCVFLRFITSGFAIRTLYKFFFHISVKCYLEAFKYLMCSASGNW